MKIETRTKFTIDESPIVEILFNKKLVIPIYQREYNWEAEHVDALIDDLLDRDKDGSFHYFGVIALAPRTSSKNSVDVALSRVIDGQQRLTTSLILISYLASKSPEIDSGDFANLFEGGISFSYEMDNTSLSENIRNLENKNFGALRGNFDKAYKTILNRLKSFSSHELKRLYKTFSNQFIVAILLYNTIESSEEMIIFENLNSKGSPLLDFDLIRNHVLSLTSDESPSDNLIKFNGKVRNLVMFKYEMVAKTVQARLKKITHFFNIFLVFKRKESLDRYTQYTTYKNYRSLIKAGQTKEEFDLHLTEVGKYLKLYLELELKIDSGDNIWIWALSNKDSHYSVVFMLFSMFGEFDQENMKWVGNEIIDGYLKVMSTHVIKLLSVFGTGQSLTKLWVHVMKDISNGITPSQLKEKLVGSNIGEPTPSNEAFRSSLLLRNKQKWLPEKLVGILEHIANEKNTAREKNDYQNRTIEHIMPKNPDSSWNYDTTLDVFKNHLNQIGNLCWFNKGANSSLGNRSFTKKKSAYANSNSHLITGKYFDLENVAMLEEFNYQTIERRTKVLSRVLIEYFDK